MKHENSKIWTENLSINKVSIFCRDSDFWISHIHTTYDPVIFRKKFFIMVLVVNKFKFISIVVSDEINEGG